MIDRLMGHFRRKLSCAEVMEVLQAYLDGEVEAETARKVAGHLAYCTKCANESHVYGRIKANLASRRREIDPAVRQALETFTRDIHLASE